MDDKTLTDEQVQRLIMATIAGNQGAATDAQITKTVDWAEDVKVSMALLHGVLSGDLDVVSPAVGELRFVISEKARAMKNVN